MDNKEIGKRIRQAREMRGITLEAVANEIGVAKSTIQRYENGKIEKIKLPVLQAIALALNVDPAWLSCKTEQMEADARPESGRGKTIFVLGRVAAGIPIEAIEEIIDTEEITEEMARTGEFFGLKIHGDSMEPRICEGDVVIVRRQDDAESGEIVIVMVNGCDATCKRIRKYRDGIELISNNPSYEPKFYSDKDVEEKPVRIIGKVVELRAKF